MEMMKKGDEERFNVEFIAKIPNPLSLMPVKELTAYTLLDEPMIKL